MNPSSKICYRTSRTTVLPVHLRLRLQTIWKQTVMNKNNLPAKQSDFLFYTGNDGKVNIEVFLKDETVWLTQKAIGELFGKSKATISEHLKKIYAEGELEMDSTVRKFRTVQTEGTGQLLEKIELECRNHGIPIPEYKYLPSNFMLEIDATEMLNKIRMQNLLGSKGKEPGKKSGRKGWSEKVVRKGGQKLTDKQQELLDILVQTPSISRRKLSSLLKINESAVQKRLETLKDKGIVKREGAAKGGYWKIMVK